MTKSRDSPKFVQIGIMSASSPGSKNTKHKFPELYARVTAAMEWIRYYTKNAIECAMV